MTSWSLVSRIRVPTLRDAENEIAGEIGPLEVLDRSALRRILLVLAGLLHEEQVSVR